MIDEKIETLRTRHQFLSEELTKPEVLSNPNSYKKLAREQSELHLILENYTKLQKIMTQISDDKTLIASEEDNELIDMARAELVELENETLKLGSSCKFPNCWIPFTRKLKLRILSFNSGVTL